MTQLRRLSLTAYEAPLCETIVDCPAPHGSEVLVRIDRCGVCHSDLHMQDGYFLLSDGKKLDVRAGRTLPFTLGHEIAGTVEKRRAAGVGRNARRQGRGVPLDRLRPMRRLPRRRGKPVQRQPPSRHLGRRRLCLARAGSASALPDRLRPAVRFIRGRADVLRPHCLFRPQATHRTREARTGTAGRHGRRRHDGLVDRTRDVSARADRRRHRCRQARSRAQGGRRRGVRSGRFGGATRDREIDRRRRVRSGRFRRFGKVARVRQWRAGQGRQGGGDRPARRQFRDTGRDVSAQGHDHRGHADRHARGSERSDGSRPRR